MSTNHTSPQSKRAYFSYFTPTNYTFLLLLSLIILFYTSNVSSVQSAEMASPIPSSTLTTSSVTFQWNAGTKENLYRLHVGSTGPGSRNILKRNNLTATSYSVTGIPTNTNTVYVRLWYRIGANWSRKDYAYQTKTETPEIISPIPGSTLTTSSATFQWSAGTEEDLYRLHVGSTGPGSKDILKQNNLTTTSYTATGIPTKGDTVYVRLWYRIGAKWSTHDYTFISVTDNFPPKLNPIGDSEINEGQSLNFTVTAHDPDGDTLSYTASNLPSGATFNESTGGFSWTPTLEQSGTYQNITFQVSDGTDTDSESITITVVNFAPKPILDPIEDFTVKEGETVTLNPTASDPEGAPLTFSYSGWMTSNPYTTTYDDAGTHTVTVTVSNGSSSVSQLVTITVTDVNRQPVLDPIADIIVNEGETVTLNPTASDPDGDTLTFTYSGWMNTNSYATSYEDAGVHPVTVTVSDGKLSVSQDVTITVFNNNNPPKLDPIADITVNAGDTVTLNPTATDLDDDALTFSYSGWMSTNSKTTTNDDVGTQTVTVTVSDGELTDSQPVSITVIEKEGTLELTFEWEPNAESELAGYKIYYGKSSRNYNSQVDVGNTTSHTLTDLVSGETYYIAATAYDFSKNESDYSQEVVYTALPANGIIDNNDPGTSCSGIWKVSAAPNSYGSDSLWSESEEGDTYAFKVFEVNDTCEVMLWWTVKASRCNSVPVDIYDGDLLLNTVYVDQLENGGQWNSLGTYDFSGLARVVIKSQGSCSTNADAIKFSN
ncbi:MAG: hypothetical protein SCALA701_23490 [Candidatus Scalindua sp.]|nr:hypothetical protein [Planctomycetota bacterium]GJQ59548.1 MAG: hypothetical protein SCALA701_23490 [Candidatus Scalindua sp.]